MQRRYGFKTRRKKRRRRERTAKVMGPRRNAMRASWDHSHALPPTRPLRSPFSPTVSPFLFFSPSYDSFSRSCPTLFLFSPSPISIFHSNSSLVPPASPSSTPAPRSSSFLLPYSPSSSRPQPPVIPSFPSRLLRSPFPCCVPTFPLAAPFSSRASPRSPPFLLLHPAFPYPSSLSFCAPLPSFPSSPSVLGLPILLWSLPLLLQPLLFLLSSGPSFPCSPTALCVSLTPCFSLFPSPPFRPLSPFCSKDSCVKDSSASLTDARRAPPTRDTRASSSLGIDGLFLFIKDSKSFDRFPESQSVQASFV